MEYRKLIGPIDKIEDREVAVELLPAPDPLLNAVIDAIDEIAHQTELLVLNAELEAGLAADPSPADDPFRGLPPATI